MTEQNSDLQINEFYFFKLNEKFIDKQKLLSLLRKIIIVSVNIFKRESKDLCMKYSNFF